MKLRDYQRASIDSIYNYFDSGKTGNPLVVLPTGSGKSLVMSFFVREVLDMWGNQRFAIVTHRKELIAQNYAELMGIMPLAPAGIYSAGLNRKEINSQVLFAGIQSIYRNAEDVGKVDLMLIDECHLVPRTGNTMYRRFIKELLLINPHMKIIGLTATHYRLDSGLLTEGEERIFTDIAIEIPVTHLIEHGYLAPLVSKGTATSYDLSGVSIRGGEYVQKDLQKVVDKNPLTESAVQEIINYGIGQKRRSWLIFCSGVDHAEHVRDCLREHDITAKTVTGSTPQAERGQILEDFKAEKIQAITNCDVLTTGFNAPKTDLIAFLRPTESTALYVQMAGRGMRIAPGKSDCLVLDFAGNVRKHGSIDIVRPKASGGSGGDGEPGEAPMKLCPECESIVFTGIRTCPDCGYEFPPPEVYHAPTADTAEIIHEQPPLWYDVDDVWYERHQKKDKPDSIKVTYKCGYNEYNEWICLDHEGYAKTKAISWLAERAPEMSGECIRLAGVNEILPIAQTLLIPKRIKVGRKGKFNQIYEHERLYDPTTDAQKIFEREFDKLVDEENKELRMREEIGEFDYDLPF